MVRHLLVRVAVFIGLSTAANACTCIGPSGNNMREIAVAKLAQAGVLFEAQVLSVELKQGSSPTVPEDAVSFTPTRPSIAVRMKAIRTYRGSLRDEVVVKMGGSTCDFDFDSGGTYLVDAEQVNSGELFTSICSATSSISDAGPELRVLRNEPPSPEDLLPLKDYYEYKKKNSWGKICGRVSHSDSSEPTSFLVTVWKVHDDFRGAMKVDLAETDKAKRTFCSNPLPPGSYFVGAEDGEWWETRKQYRGYYPAARRFSEAKPLTVKAAATVNAADLVLYPEEVHYVRGRVRDGNGRLLGSGELQVTIVSAESDLLYDPLSKWIEKDGFFIFGYVPKGRYRLFARDTEQSIDVTGSVSDLVLQLK
jgi:hypothetical protein